ncbi:MAG: CPBP family intramembrane metalloprotease [Candidatus Marinimicrobia bacterium]|nr:CPBP family intramembrane metalloprotease [Candidatus Neomarinimicrobiota bacterium]
MIEKLNLKDKRLITVCLIFSVVSLFITLNYFKQAFPEASIDMDITKEEAQEIAETYLANRGYDVQDYMHAARFGYLDEAKTFLEHQLSAERAGEILNKTNSYYWQNRWFIPEQKEEFYVKISTTRNIAEFEHKIDEDAPGDSLTQENALNIARFFLVGTVGMDIQDWELMESKTEKLKNRWDHKFEWKKKSFNVKESTHRLTVKVHGDQVDYYNEWIKVPDTWKREYKKVRSDNDLLNSIGKIGLFLTIFLLFIMILVRTRKKDIRWKTAFTYSGIIAVLLIFNEFNNLPLQLYSYDTKISFGSFLTETILFQLIFLPLLMSVFLGVLIAGSEPLYRDQYPHHISFRHILTVQGIRSRSFFNSAIIGISLTFVTFAFQTIFYLITNKFGGWSPTEIPDIDRLGTYIPWVGVLLVGLIPAFLEESIFRTFLIPFLQKHTKSTVLAVVLSSIIWGLGHAGYASQPFYIRVVEVSVMGFLISWIFLRYGILATLIWHFSVNAVYSAMILLRSGNEYYFTTGAVCAGLVMLPLIYSIIAYRRNGGFVSSNNLVNALDTEIFEEKEETKKVIEKAKISVSYKPLSIGRVKLGIVLGFVGILIFYLVSTFEKFNEPIYNFTWLDKNRSEATDIAREYLLSRGFNLDEYRPVANPENWLSTRSEASSDGNMSSIISSKGKPEHVAYIMENAGKDKLRSFLSDDKLGAMAWTVRFFKPETKREYKVWMLAKEDEGGYPYFKETISDTAYIPFLTKEEARDLVRDFAENTNIDLIDMELVEEETIEKENRTDYYFKYKANDHHKDNVSEARLYYEFEVHGDHIGGITKDIKLPEAWQREYQKTDIYNIIQVFCKMFLFLILLILGIRYLLKLLKQNKPNWKQALSGGIIFTILFLLLAFNSSAVFFSTYNTAASFKNFIIQICCLTY